MKAYLAIALFTACNLSAQTQPQAPRFEAASVKPAQPGPQQGVWTATGRIRLLNMPLKEIIAYLHGVQDYQVSGPTWIDTEHFDIIAKLPEDVAALPEKQRDQKTLIMGQTLLADRFHLALHEETRQMPVYALVAAKGGVKLQGIDPEPGDNVQLHYSRAHGHLAAKKMPMSQFLEILNGGLVDLPVVNDTDIHGTFDFTLDWTPESAASGQPESKPPFALALQDQLGLKLDPRKSPMKVLVIDHADKVPVEN